ncbi:MAG: zinc ribbon domain-containing protein, partial [Thermoplasmata archaeon]
EGERVKEGMEIWLNASAEDIDAFDVLRFSWFDNGEPLGDGNSIKVKLKPGRHTLSLEVSDGAEKALAEVSIVVLKAERVTVADYSWVMGAGIGIALILILVVLAAAFIAVSRRRRRAEGEEAGAAGAPGAGIEGAATAPGVSAAAAGAGAGMAAAGAAARPSEEDEILKDAKSLVAEVEDALAEHLEKHPEGAARVSGAMEKLDLARDFIKEGDGEAAMEFALEARGALAAAREPAAPPGKKVRKQPGGLRCPSCGEALEPEWPVCPACGHETR